MVFVVHMLTSCARKKNITKQEENSGKHGQLGRKSNPNAAEATVAAGGGRKSH